MVLPREEHTNSCPVQNSPENMRTSNIISPQQVIFKNAYIHRNTHIYTYICRLITIGDKIDHKFEGAWGGVYIRGLEGRKKKREIL